MTLPPYTLLRIPAIRATDEFELLCFCRLLQKANYAKALFTHNGRSSYATLYGAGRNVSWIRRNERGGLMEAPTPDAGPYELTFTICRGTLGCTSPKYGMVEVLGDMPPALDLNASTGTDMGCLLIGACFTTDYSGFQYMEDTLEMHYLTIRSATCAIELGQDIAGRFYNKTTGMPVQMMDSREISLVYLP